MEGGPAKPCFILGFKRFSSGKNPINARKKEHGPYLAALPIPLEQDLVDGFKAMPAWL
jgi:hypothetical protein